MQTFKSATKFLSRQCQSLTSQYFHITEGATSLSRNYGKERNNLQKCSGSTRTVKQYRINIQHTVLYRNYFTTGKATLTAHQSNNALSSHSKNLKKISSNLLVIQKRHYPQLRKKFYSNVSVVNGTDEEGQYYEVHLEKRKLKTPGGKEFKVRNETLAHAIAAEWAGQKDFILQSYMHLTGLMNTVIDNPLRKTKNDLAAQILEGLAQDTIIYRAPDFETKLLERQKQEWDPIISWFNTEFSAHLPVIYETLLPPVIQHSEFEVFNKFLLSFTYPSLTGLNFSIESLGSGTLAVAVIKNKLSVQDAVYLSSLERRFQSEHWGKIEWSHELELEETLARASAGILFSQLTNS